MENLFSGNTLLQLGVGGIFVIMVLDRVITLVRSKNSAGGSFEKDFRKMARRVEDVYNWAKVIDPETGEKRIYTDRALVTEMKAVLQAVRGLVLELRRRPCMIDEKEPE